MGTIETCPRCQGEVYCHFSESRGITVISGQCHYCGKLLAYRLTPSEEEKAEAPKPLGKQTGWRLTCFDPSGRKYVTEYGLDEKEKLDSDLADAKVKMAYWAVDGVRA